MIRQNIKLDELEKIEKILNTIDIQFKLENENQKVYLDGEDVTKEIRTSQVDNLVAKFAAIKQVRDKMTPIQQQMGKNSEIIMEGRDIGTVVFPNADLKIFLDCSIEERAKRRYKQNQEKGIPSTFEEVLESIRQRHILETQREIAPLKQAEDAIYIDSTNMTIEEVVEKVIKEIEKVRKWGKYARRIFKTIKNSKKR